MVTSGEISKTKDSLTLIYVTLYLHAANDVMKEFLDSSELMVFVPAAFIWQCESAEQNRAVVNECLNER